MFAIALFLNLLINRKKYRIDQGYFDCINLNCEKQKCFISFFLFNNVLYKHYFDYNKNYN